MYCPVDQTELRVVSSGELDVEACPECGGVWIHHSRFIAFKCAKELIRTTPGVADALRQRDGRSGTVEFEPRPCPHCRLSLAPRSDGTLQVAACMTCGGAWVASCQVGHLLWDGPAIGQAGDGDSGGETTRFDRFSFNHPITFLLALPLASIGALALNASALSGIMRPFHIWIHELGHATIAWLSGRRALPLPIGWTSWQPERSGVVYVALLFLLGVLFYRAWTEKLRATMAFAVAVALVQLLLTWTFPGRRVELWITFGGIGGEFYLSALLMVLFYFPMPDRFRWDFWRYPVLLVAASTFWENFSFWNRVARGRESIPWGSILGAGDAGGDMDRLVFEHGWNNEGIIGAYSLLGDLCLILVAGVYVAFVVAQRGRIVSELRRRLGRGGAV